MSVLAAGRGRALIAARDVGAGEVVLRSERMGTSLRVKHEQYWCVECLRHLLPDWYSTAFSACLASCLDARQPLRVHVQVPASPGRL